MGSAFCFGLGCTLAAIMPNYWFFALALVGVGISVQTFTTTANSVLQLSTEPFMRGRIIAMFMAIALGTTPIGAPIVGWVADRFGARWALGVGGASGFAAAIVGFYYLLKYEPAIFLAGDSSRTSYVNRRFRTYLCSRPARMPRSE